MPHQTAASKGAPNDFAMAARVRKMTHAPVLIH
jgi:hypothetical protein